MSRGAVPAAVAVAWLLRNRVVATTIVGAMTIEELRSDLDGLSGAVGRRGDGTTRPDLARAVRSPQAYAW